MSEYLELILQDFTSFVSIISAQRKAQSLLCLQINFSSICWWKNTKRILFSKSFAFLMFAKAFHKFCMFKKLCNQLLRNAQKVFFSIKSFSRVKVSVILKHSNLWHLVPEHSKRKKHSRLSFRHHRNRLAQQRVDSTRMDRRIRNLKCSQRHV